MGKQDTVKVECQFNPNELKITRDVHWKDKSSPSKDQSKKQFAGGGPNGLSVSLLFDSTSDGTDVRDKYAALKTMSKIDTETTNTSTTYGEPPQVQFQWGTILSFTGVITSFTEMLKMFKGDGTPIRATVDVSFSEVLDETAGQNPTTRSESRKVWVVHEGQTLPWIAFQEYGKCAAWRHIAETNNLDNPMDLRPGQVLKLVPLR